MQDWIERTLGIGPQTREQLLWSIVVIAAVFIVRWLVLRHIHRRLDDPEAWFRARKTATYVASTISFFALWRIWFSGFDDVATFLGLVSAGLAIALSDVLKNVAGWMFIVLRRPFRVGDRVQVGVHAGDVVDIRMFRFSIMEIRNWVDADQPTGRIVEVPNGSILTEASANYTAGFAFIWHEVSVLVTFESDWERAEQIVRDAMFGVAPDPKEMAAGQIREAAAKYLIRLPQLEPGTYVAVRDSGVLITARMLIPAQNRRGIDDAMWRELLRGIDATPEVELAYPTVRTYLPDPVAIDQR